ncbi:MAG: efflux RND transporter periplasmic adaptor subunit [Candidatus Ancaeobacter aquaticus]|nr:efflux RND transporter periplasmic adaptor subunit [Candidatus Ancaeobacter aquaticus]
MESHNTQTPSNDRKRSFLPVIIIGIGVALAAIIILTKPVEKQRKFEQVPVLVQVEPLKSSSELITVRAMGTVIPAQEIVLKPRVSGEVLEISPHFIPGGRFKTGELILQIDPADYKLIEEQKEAEVARAQYDYKMELGQQEIAKHEWGMIETSKDQNELDQELVLRKPHLKKAKASLGAAQASLERADLDLKRTSVTAPFNCVVRSKNVDLGAQVDPQTQLATLIGTDEYWVQVSIPVSRLKWLTLPTNIHKTGSSTVIQLSAEDNRENEWEGHIVGRNSELETQGRMAQVLVSVKDPLDLDHTAGPKIPLLIGSYVNVQIEGKTIDAVYTIPRSALRDGNKIWIVGSDNTLLIKKVAIVWREEDQVYVKNNITNGDLLVTSNIPIPVAGIKLEIEDKNESVK